TSAQAYSGAVASGLPYDPLRDFVAIAPLTSQPYVLVVGLGAGISTLVELLAAAAAKPQQLTFGSTGVGTATHVGLEKMNLLAGIRAAHVPAQGADSIVETIAKTADGLTTYAMSPISIASPLIRDGRLRALGTTTAQRSKLLPEVPTIAEAGLAGYDHPIWYGMWAPAGTPPLAIETIARDVAGALTDPGLLAWIDLHGGYPITMSQAEFAAFVLSEVESASRIIGSTQ
ncbi:MAG: tripartite tricarboxylate transporter substrate-binding protein, partial [Chloroflexota bacterium]